MEVDEEFLDEHGIHGANDDYVGIDFVEDA